MSASLLTCAGTSVGVSISTHRRMPARMVLESKGLIAVIGTSAANKRLSHALAAQAASMLDHDEISGFGRGFVRGDLLDQGDDAAPQLGIGDTSEGARQRQPFGGREEIRDIGWRGPFAEPVAAGCAGRPALEQEGHR